MSLRCAVCGSTRITSETKKEGYDVKKGVVGTVLVGVPGALAGAGGKSITYYHCADCGQVLNKTMHSVESDWIDMLLKNPENWIEQLKEQKSKYKNIEWEESTCNKQVVDKNSLSYDERVEQIKAEILTYLNQIGTLTEEDILMKRYSNDDSFLDETLLYDSAIRNLEASGRVHREIIGNKHYLRLVTDINEMQKFYLQSAARQEAVDWMSNFFDNKKHSLLIINNIDYQKKYTRSELLELLSKAFEKEIVSDNPYTLEQVVNSLVGRLPEFELITIEGDYCTFRTLEEAERIYNEKENAKEMRRKQEKDIIKNKILNYLNTHLGMHEDFKIWHNLSEYSLRKISDLLEEMYEEEGTVEKKIEKNKLYYAISGYTEKLKEENERKRKEAEKKALEKERKRQQKRTQLNNEISNLRTQLRKQQELFSANKYKLFGEGAKIKNAARLEIATLTNNISQLEAELSNLK